MILVYICFGILAGTVAAVIAWFSSASFFTVVLAYVLAGLVGMLGSMAVFQLRPSMPKSSNPVEQPITRRS